MEVETWQCHGGRAQVQRDEVAATWHGSRGEEGDVIGEDVALTSPR